MIYLDKFIHDLCERYNYPAVMVDIMCNTCYQGFEGDRPMFRHEEEDLTLGLGPLTENLKIVVQELCMNSLYGVYEVLSNLVDFIILVQSIPKEAALKVIPTNDIKRMVELFNNYKKYLGNEKVEFAFSDDNGHSILEAIKEDLVDKLDNLKDDVQANQGDFTVCERFFKKDSFFEDCCLLIREVLQRGFFKTDELIQQKYKEFYQTDIQRFPQLEHIYARKQNPNHMLVKSTSSDFQTIKDLYKELDKPKNHRRRRFFNKALVLSGMHSEAFSDCLRTSNEGGRNPVDFQNEAFFAFDAILDQANVLHDVELDDFRLSNEIFVAIREGLKKLRTYTPINVAKPISLGREVLHLESPRSVRGPIIPEHARNFRNFVSEVPTKTTTTVTTTTSGTTVGFLLLFLGLLFGVLLILK